MTQLLLAGTVAASLLAFATGGALFSWFALWPLGGGFAPWQLATYALLHGGAVEARSSVIDENIQPAKFRINSFEECLDLLRFGHVGLHHQRAPAHPADLFSGGVSGSLVAHVIDDDSGALAGQAQCDGPADAGGSPGDEGNLAVQPEVLIESCIVHRSRPLPTLRNTCVQPSR